MVGGFDGAGDLVYCGHLVSGFSHLARRDLYDLLSAIGCANPPFGGLPPDLLNGGVAWVQPVCVLRCGVGWLAV